MPEHPQKIKSEGKWISHYFGDIVGNEPGFGYHPSPGRLTWERARQAALNV
jgi:hypothetical protein